jgi:hypothetical protein
VYNLFIKPVIRVGIIAGKPMLSRKGSNQSQACDRKKPQKPKGFVNLKFVVAFVLDVHLAT